MRGEERGVDGATDEVDLPHGGSVRGTGPAGIEIRRRLRCGDDTRVEGPLRCGAIEAEGRLGGEWVRHGGRHRGSGSEGQPPGPRGPTQ